MKKLFLLLFLFLTIQVRSQAPDWAWSKSGGGVYEERPTSLSSDKQGNIFLAGQFTSPSISFGGVTLLNDPSGDSTSIFLVKYDSLGNVLWGRTGIGDGGDYVDGISTDTSGNIIITGSFLDSISFSGSMLYGSSWGNSSTFLVKYDPSGNILWLKSYGGIMGGCIGQVVTTDNDENIYISGFYGIDSISFDGIILLNTGSYSIFVAKLDPLGNAIWAKGSSGLATGLNFATGITVDPAGNVIVTGNFQSDVIHFETDSIVNASIGIYMDDSYIVKYDASGNFMWCKGIGGTSMDISTGIKTDGNGNILITGYFISPSLTFGSTTFTNPDGSADIFTAKYDPSGNVLWAKQGHGSNEDAALGIAMDDSGNTFITGYFTSNDLTFGTDTLTNYGIKIFVTKYDSLGNIAWIRANRIDNFSECITIDGTGHVTITGRLSDLHMYLGADTLDNSCTTLPYSDDIYVSHLSLENNVWPGDANRDMMVNNSDLLPIGLFYGQSGIPRSVTSDLWEPYIAGAWGTAEPNGEDIKHVDCNGDGIIDNNDTLAINMNYDLTHAMIPNNTMVRTSVPDLYFLISGTFGPGQFIDAELWLGNSSSPVTNFYGIAFDIYYYSWLVQAGTESLHYPTSFLGTPGVNALTIQKTETAASKIHGAESRVDHINANGYGKIADFTFQLSTTLNYSDSLVIDVLAYKANDSIGSPLYFNTHAIGLSSPVGINDYAQNDFFVSVSPNPATTFSHIQLFLNEPMNVSIEITDQLGRKLTTLLNEEVNQGPHDYIFSPTEFNCGVGIYFARITMNEKTIVKKIVVF